MRCDLKDLIGDDMEVEVQTVAEIRQRDLENAPSLRVFYISRAIALCCEGKRLSLKNLS
jgi:hypothetical protein